MNIKVCHVTSVHTRYDTRIFYKECTSLANAGYDVTLLVADGKPEETRNDVKIVSADFVPTSRYKRILLSGRVMYKAAMQIDAEIYHLHDPELLPVGRKLKAAGKKVIFDSHEDVSGQILRKEWIPRILRLPVSCVYSAYAGHVLKMMDYLITVTPAIVEKLKKINHKIELITNYPIINAINRDRRENPYGNPVFVFAGGISRQWRHETILEALEKLNARYLLMGWGESSYIDSLKNFPSWEKVEYLGKVTQEDVKKNFKHCVAGLAIVDYSPNANGNVGTLGNTKLFEYMQAALPVICTDFILWRDIITKWECGICVPPDDVGALCHAMQYLIDNPDIALKMGANGRKAIRSEFNWEIEEEKLLSLYESLTNH